MTVIEEIAAERRRQIEVGGWSAEHDDGHAHGDLCEAGAAYAINAGAHMLFGMSLPRLRHKPPSCWPKFWEERWKPTTPRRDLIRAAALIVAEIERLDRAAAQETP